MKVFLAVLAAVSVFMPHPSLGAVKKDSSYLTDEEKAAAMEKKDMDDELRRAGVDPSELSSEMNEFIIKLSSLDDYDYAVMRMIDWRLDGALELTGVQFIFDSVRDTFYFIKSFRKFRDEVLSAPDPEEQLRLKFVEFDRFLNELMQQTPEAARQVRIVYEPEGVLTTARDPTVESIVPARIFGCIHLKEYVEGDLLLNRTLH